MPPLSWIVERRLRLYGAGWAMLVLALILGVLGLGSAPDRISRYPIGEIVVRVGVLTLGLTATAMLVHAIRERMPRYVLGVLASAVVFVPFVWSGLLFRDPFGNVLCSRTRGCFFLRVADIPTDVVFEIWRAPSRFALTLTKLQTGIAMNYSEDGSYLSNSHLLLSGNERILVLARGGYMVDAIDLESGRLLSTFVGWTEPDRDAKMQANSDAIDRVLEANRL